MTERRSDLEELAGIGAGVARLAAGAWLRTTVWTLDTSYRVSLRVARAAVDGESPTELLNGLAADVRGAARAFLGVRDEEPLPDDPVASDTAADAEADAAEVQAADVEELRRLGADLLSRSAEVNGAGPAHPAYLRIISELAPDEARILRLLCREGPRPAVDVRSTKVPLMSSELVAPGLNMIGREAGVQHLDRTPAHLNNLERLGLIWFSREPLPNPLDYQVLEAQPEVIEAMRRVGRGKTVRRSIHLTPFGDDFCRTVLPLDPGGITAEFEVPADG